MLCEVCHRNEAERKLNKSVGGTVKTLYVCKECFNRGGQIPPEAEKKCPHCGRTLSQIKSTLIVGCPHCYDFFKIELYPVIRQVQKL